MSHSHAVCRRRWVVGCHPPALSTVGAGPHCKEPAADTDCYFTDISSQRKVLSKKSIHNQPSVPPKCLRPYTSPQRMADAKASSILFAFDLFPDLVHHTAVSTECIHINISVWIRSAFSSQPSRSFRLAVLRFTSRADLRANAPSWFGAKQKQEEGAHPKCCSH